MNYVKIEIAVVKKNVENADRIGVVLAKNLKGDNEIEWVAIKWFDNPGEPELFKQGCLDITNYEISV